MNKFTSFLAGIALGPASDDPRERYAWIVKTTSLTCFVLIIILLISSILFCASRREFGFIVACGVFGWTAGWLIGTLFSPIQTSEMRAFKQVLGIVGSFMSGWTLSKIDKAIEQTGSETAETQFIVYCVAIVFATFTMSAVSNFIWRRYSETPNEDRAATGNQPPTSGVTVADKPATAGQSAVSNQPHAPTSPPTLTKS